MILANCRSDWLKQFLEENGGAITLSLQSLVIN
jgi:hypothetical protein